MKIIIDLQSAQGISRKRGIGRYSLDLSKALVRQAKNHDIYLVLNTNCANSIESIRTDFSQLIPQDHIKVFEIPRNISGHDHANQWRIQAAEKIREHFLASLSPDIVYISSPFEGWNDDSPISIGQLNHNYMTVATLYDLIPFLFPEFYIKNSGAPHFFVQKMQFLKQVDFLFTISDSTSQEAIELLSLPSHRILNCSVGVDDKFKSITVNNEQLISLKEYGINRNFIFYIGGFDFRKNVQGLVEAFSLLSPKLRKRYQLVIIVNNEESTIAHAVYTFRTHFKLNADEIVFLNYVSEDKLIILYNACSLFVFPSLHEGFGLPIIEAMACGAPVISANTSSMPEATGCPEALFDPKNPCVIAKKITEVLTNEDFRNFLKQHGLKQAKKFTWENTAKKKIAALENLYENKKRSIKKTPEKLAYYKKKLAYISPLPPEKSGIADYSAQVVPELGRFYEIILITSQRTVVDHRWLNGSFPIKDINWFIKHALSFDIVLYQFGNSHFHYAMLDLLDAYPGIVVLHDFFLSGLFHWTDVSIPSKKNIFYHALYESHGFAGLAHHQKKGRADCMEVYPCNLSVLTRSLGIITHSTHSINLAKQWYGDSILSKFISIPPPHLDKIVLSTEQIKTKKELGFSENDFLICSFGVLHPNKLNHRTVSVFLNNLLVNENTFLVFIGEIFEDYHNKIISSIIKDNKQKKQICFTGYVSGDILQKYFLATDIAVQLRTNSRGETSACLLTCLSYGIPTIANDHGSSSEINDKALLKLNDHFTDTELSASIDKLYKDSNLRKNLSDFALRYIREYHHPSKTGEQYYRAIEDHYHHDEFFKEQHLIKNLSKNDIQQASEEDILTAASALAANRLKIGLPQLLIDITALTESEEMTETCLTLLDTLITSHVSNFRVAAIYYKQVKNQYYYAHEFIIQKLNIYHAGIEEFPVEISPSDTLLFFNIATNAAKQIDLFREKWRIKGVKSYILLIHKLSTKNKIFTEKNNALLQTNLEKIVSITDGFICTDEKILQAILFWLDTLSIKRNSVLNLGTIDSRNKIIPQLLKLILENKWQVEWKKSGNNELNNLPLKIITRNIHIAKKEYAIQGEIRYLDHARNPFDPFLVSLFNTFCQENYHVLDLGANIGLTAIALANICRRGKVIAIEPMHTTFKLLENNIKNTSLKNVFLYNFGVGNKECRVMMQSHGDFLAGAFVIDSFQQASNECVTSRDVAIKPLDSLFEQLEIERIDFIKMDLEGYELFAIEGAKELIKRFQPTVYLEMNHWCLNIFYRITLPEFRERLFEFFPYVFALDPTEADYYLDFNPNNNFNYIAHEHLTKFKYYNLIAGFNKNEIIKKLKMLNLEKELFV